MRTSHTWLVVMFDLPPPRAAVRMNWGALLDPGRVGSSSARAT